MLKKLLIPAILFIASAASAATLEETFDHTYDSRAGAKLSLENVNGHITIRAWDQPRIHVHAVKQASSWDSDAAKKALLNTRIEVTPTADSLRVITRTPKDDFHWLDFLTGSSVNASVTYEVTVPRSATVKIDNTNGGLDIHDVTGELKLETTNGRIELERCGGRVDASTTNGSIHAELVRVAAGQPLLFETTNGHITVSVPSNFAARVDAENTNGSIRTELPVTTTHTERHSLQGTLNGGGAELRMHTTNGSIELRASAK